MFEKVGVPILGIVENMAVHVCEKCGHVEHIFGEEGGKRLAAEYKMDYLGALPLNLSIRVQADSGRPTRGQRSRRRDRRALQARRPPGRGQDRAAQPRTSRRSSRPSRSRRTPERRRATRLTAHGRADPRDPRRACRGDGARARAEPLGGLALRIAEVVAARRRLRRRARASCATTASCSARSIPASRSSCSRDQAEGYYLNLSSGAPVWFVVWRIDDDDPVARLAGDGEPVVQRGRPLARRAGARRQRAAAGRRSSPGCRPTPTSTTGRSRRSARRPQSFVAPGRSASERRRRRASCRAGRGARREARARRRRRPKRRRAGRAAAAGAGRCRPCRALPLRRASAPAATPAASRPTRRRRRRSTTSPG